MDMLKNDAVPDEFERRLHATLPNSANASAKSLLLALARATNVSQKAGNPWNRQG